MVNIDALASRRAPTAITGTPAGIVGRRLPFAQIADAATDGWSRWASLAARRVEGLQTHLPRLGTASPFAGPTATNEWTDLFGCQSLMLSTTRGAGNAVFF